MKTKTIAIEKLVADPANARRHDRRNLTAIAASLKKHGQVLPVLVQKGTNQIIGGNGTVSAMKALGWTECFVVETEATGKEAIELAIKLNRTAELATWDKDVLQEQLKMLSDDFDLGRFGWSDKDLDVLDDLEFEGDDGRSASAKRGLVYKIVIDCQDERHQASLLAQLEEDGLVCTPLLS